MDLAVSQGDCDLVIELMQHGAHADVGASSG